MKTTFALKIDAGLRDYVRAFCLARGIKQGFFVEQALREHLEHEEWLDDLKDFKRLKGEEPLATEFSAYLARSRR